ncbi:MAG: TolB family protein [Gaiellaceae bacterium]
MRRRVPKGLLALAVVAAGLVTLTPAQGGVFSGDNGPIAYTCGTTICTINPDGTAKNSTTFPTGASDPSWSSDESEIAYVSASAISVAHADGTSPTPLGTVSGSTQPTFSFDGDRVAYVRNGDIFTIQSNTGGGALPVTNTVGVDDADPAYSPDGTKIAFASVDPGTGYDIWTVNVTTGVLHQVTNAAGDERSPTWSPSGATIVYSAGATPGLFASSSTASPVPAPTNLNVAGTEPAFSPDGTKIAFERWRHSNSRRVSRVYTVGRNGRGLRMLTNRQAFNPSWQPRR